MIAVAKVIYVKKAFVQSYIKRKKAVIISNIPSHFDFEVYTKNRADKQKFFVAQNNKEVLDKAEHLNSYTSIIAVINITSYNIEIVDIIVDTATADEISDILKKHKNYKKLAKLF